jgi:hypothetical protein
VHNNRAHKTADRRPLVTFEQKKVFGVLSSTKTPGMADPVPRGPPPPAVTVIGGLPMPIDIDAFPLDYAPCSTVTVAGADGDTRTILCSAAVNLEEVRFLSDTLQGRVFQAVVCGAAPEYERTGVYLHPILPMLCAAVVRLCVSHRFCSLPSHCAAPFWLGFRTLQTFVLRIIFDILFCCVFVLSEASFAVKAVLKVRPC